MLGIRAGRGGGARRVGRKPPPPSAPSRSTLQVPPNATREFSVRTECPWLDFEEDWEGVVLDA